MRRLTYFALAFAGCILLVFPDVCLAATADADIIARIVKKFYDQSQTFTNVAKKYALQLFGLCATLEVAYLGIKAALGRAEIGETIKNFCISLLACGFFLAVINNYAEWSAAVINGLKSIAGEMGNVQDSSDTAFKEAVDLVSQMWTVIQDLGMSEIGLILGMIIALFIVIVCFCLITAQVIFIKCEAYVAMAAACILVGLGGTSFFRNYATNVIRYIVSVAFKLFVLQLVIGVGYSFMREAITPKADFPTIIVIIGVAIVLLSLVRSLPDTVAGIINGSHVGSGGLMDTVKTVGAAGAAAGAGLVAAGTNLGLAVQTARAQGAGGMGDMLKGTASNLWSGMQQARQNQAERQGTVGSALRQRLAEVQMPKSK